MRRLALLALVVAAACTPPKRETLGVPHNGNPAALNRFTDAQRRFLRDARGDTKEEFARIIEEFPQDPIVPYAELYEAMAAIRTHDAQRAVSVLTHAVQVSTDPKLTLKAELYLGIAKNYAGDPAGARPLLAKAAKAVETDEDRVEYLAAVAFATAAGDRPLASLPAFDELWPRATATEHAVILERIEQVVAAAPPDALDVALKEITDKNGPSMAIVASRLADVAAAGGDTAGAKRLRDQAAPARAAVGLPRTATAVETAGNADGSNIVGALLPLGVKNQATIANTTVGALGLLSGATGGGAVTPLEVRAVTAADNAAVAVEELAKANVVAIVGPIDESAVDAAGARAEGLGVPLLSLSSRPEDRTTGKWVFHVRHSATQRAKMLAQRAIAKGVTTFAIMAADNGYGKAVAAAFAAEVDKQGGKVVGKVMYSPGGKQFKSEAERLPGGAQGVFVADNAERLELVVPALATAGYYPKPLGTKKVVGGHPVLLLSTAEGLSATFAANAGRYAEGAMLAPGFYADTQDAATKPFIDKYVAAYGKSPGALEAYAYDAAQLAAAAGGRGRAALQASVASGSLDGVTGTIKFDSDHLRSDPGNVYTIVDENGNYAIRADRK